MYPILFKIGSLNVYSYGLMVSIGYAVGTIIALREAKKEGLNCDNIFDMLLLQLIIGICGSRLFYLAEYTPNKLTFSDFLSFEQGGLTFYGSVIFSFVFDMIYLKLRRIPFWQTMDCIGLGLPLGIMIARFGCFLNGCCYGKPCSESIGFHFRHSGQGFFHPTQLYESAAMVIVFVIVLFIRKKRNSYGSVFLASTGFYALFRFFIEFWRADNPTVLFGMTLSQIISILIIISIYFIVKKLNNMPEMRIMPKTDIIEIK